ncbi:aldehyde dehydrogenase family 16 member A1 [Clupea harengus]|uniref:Aldehyde dehydrogenase family 16 member A1 n=1 Tax=Clupea harengus TaxID=7950 RepID=A0A6P3VJJ9_CLUHA|nr:aldehyde dehydrogenase family 16 member A1 [Clupea harengus]
MAGSTTKTVFEIFQTMDYGPSNSTFSTAQSWLELQDASLGLFVEGKFAHPAGRQTRSLTDSTGRTVCSLMCAVEEDVSGSVSSAAKGLKGWSELSCHQRAQPLLRLAGALQRHSQCVSELCELSQSPCSPAALVRLAQYYAGWAQLRDTLIPDWIPRGVVAVVGSEDCSLYSLWLKILPALAVGNTVVVVPGMPTAPPSLLLAQLFGEAGLPVGVLNVITGSDVSLGAKVAQNPNMAYMTFTGNKQDAEALCRQTAGWGVPVSVSLSLDSVCPYIIFESADIDSAVDGVMETVFKKRRECQWALYVQESVLKSVVARLKLRLAGMKSIPLQSEAHRALVDTAVQEAERQGATIIQPCPPPTSGTLYPPTLLCGVAPSCQAVVCPAPGPILPLLTFRGPGEGVTLGNHSSHGHAASIWTEDLTLALETTKSLSVGSVWVNSLSVSDPSLSLSGRKNSGNCTDGGREGLYQFLRPSSSFPLPRSSPCALDYGAFGAAAAKASVPEGFDSSSIPRSYSHLVAGRSCKADSGCSRAVLSPEGAVLAHCPDGGRKDVRNAVEAAIKAQPSWMKKSPSARAQSLYSLAGLLVQKRQPLVTSIQTQTGLTLEEANQEVDLSISRLYEWAARCDKDMCGVPLLPQSGSALSISEPVGVLGVVLPDSKSLLPLVSLLGAAVAMGNAVVMVPSEKYPLPALEFIQILQSSDLPGGVVSIISGGRDQLTQALANHSVIQAVWYWGSKKGCQFLQHTCASPLKRLWLHCEGDEQKAGEGGLWSLPQPSLMEEMWRQAVVWKSVWIPTA